MTEDQEQKRDEEQRVLEQLNFDKELKINCLDIASSHVSNNSQLLKDARELYNWLNEK